MNYWGRRHAAKASGSGDEMLRKAIKRVRFRGSREQRAVGDVNASEEGGAKRAGRTKKSEAAPDADASASAVVYDGNPKGAITACEHTNRPLYSKGLCK